MNALYELSFSIPRTVIQFALVMLGLCVFALIISKKAKTELDKKRVKGIFIVIPIFTVIIVATIMGLNFSSYLEECDALENGTYKEVTGYVEARTYNGYKQEIYVVDGVEFDLRFENMFVYQDVYTLRELISEGQHLKIKYMCNSNQNAIIHIDEIVE